MEKAMAGASAGMGKDFDCYSTQYTIAGGEKRTMRVYVHYVMYRGYEYKGIVTAYWVEGHRDWCR